jgi:predicted nucleic acid-binding protein
VRVFLDTNVLFSGIYSKQGNPARVLDLAVSDDFQVVTSIEVVAELTRNVRLKAPGLLGDMTDFLTSVKLEYVQPDEAAVVVRYQQGFGTDAPIVAAAIGAQVDYFCSGDKRLLRRIRDLAPGLNAVSPADLLRLLE